MRCKDSEDTITKRISTLVQILKQKMNDENRKKLQAELDILRAEVESATASVNNVKPLFAKGSTCSCPFHDPSIATLILSTSKE